MKHRTTRGWICGHLMAFVLGLLTLAGSPGPAWADEFLAPEQAFRLELSRPAAGMVELNWTIADGYHLYADRISVTADPPQALAGVPQIPAGARQFDKALGKEVAILEHRATVRVAVDPQRPDASLSVTSQGCADAGLCYPPQTTVHRLSELSLTAGSGTADSAPAMAPLPATPQVAMPGAAPPAIDADDSGTIERLLHSRDRLQIVLAFLVFGLLLSFTPCVLPMLPILSSILVGEEQVSRSRGLALAASYSMGMALVYTSLGVAAGLAGEGLAAAMQKPAVLLTFAGLMLALSLSMFDVYQLQLPSALQTRLGGASGRLKAGKMTGVFIMGALSALIVGPCVAAPLAGALVYISQTRDVISGGLALFSMACGMSVPLLLTGVSAGTLLPRAGGWMIGVKRFFGVMLIAVAIWMATPALPGWVPMLAWGALAIGCAVQLRAFDPLGEQAGAWPRIWKGVGVVLLVLGTLQLVGLLSGGRDLLQPLSHLASARTAGAAGAARLADAGGSGTAGQQFRRMPAGAGLEQAIRNAQRPVLLDVYADWCTACKEMEHLTFKDDKVARAMDRFELIQVDVTDNSEHDRQFLRRFGLFGPPGVLVLGRDGAELREARTVGFLPPDKFVERLNRAAI